MIAKNATVEFWNNGKIKSVEIFDEKLVNFPSRVIFYDNGKICQEVYTKDSLLHNENGPAYLEFYECGQKYREQFCLNGEFHNENGPAAIGWHENGLKYYEHFYLNGQLHNDKGPARIVWHENGKKWYEHFCLNGQFLPKEQWEERVNPKPKTVMVEFEIDGQKVSVSKDDLLKLLNSTKS